MTLDNTGNNNTTCQTIQDIHTCHGLVWNSTEQQLPYIQLFSYTFLTLKIPRCLRHVINLGNVDIMQNITKIATVKNATVIWEYEPTQTDNCVLGGSLDIIMAIRTLAIKVIIPLLISQINYVLIKLDTSLWQGLYTATAFLSRLQSDFGQSEWKFFCHASAVIFWWVSAACLGISGQTCQSNRLSMD